MSIITVELIALLLAAWKAPAMVKELGLMALVTGFFWQLVGLYQAAGAVQMAGDISLGLMAGGFKVSLISVLYGMAVYFLSLIIRAVQKPKI